jgi:alkylation response protein AidB-like acyl-CoA dehydrogenase
MDSETILANIRDVSSGFAAARQERQSRRALDAADFAALRDAGFFLTGVPRDQGGIWKDVRGSTRPICEMLRTLAHGDPAVALVCAMHPSVLSFWLASPSVDSSSQEAWTRQCESIFGSVRDGALWGTITSEPGSGGDMMRTKTVAKPTDTAGSYLITGQKQFGSGSGISSYMFTTAIPEGESAPDFFILDMRDVPWDGSKGVTMTAPWDGWGMAATQSHAMAFADFPATRSAAPGQLFERVAATTGFIPSAFAAVIVGIVETAVETARQQIARRRDSLRPYEQVEWTRAETEGWLIQQAYEGMLRAVEEGDEGRRRATQGKMAIAELAETATGRLCRVIGGGTFSRYSPFGYWHEDVRALGFLRPPWGLAYDSLFEWSCAES